MLQRHTRMMRTHANRKPALSCCFFDLARPSGEIRRCLRALDVEVVEAAGVDLIDSPMKIISGRRHAFVMISLDTVGPEQLELLHQVRALTAVPIFIVSRSSTSETRIAAFEAGADEHVSPSVARDELAARINAKLRRARFSFSQT